MTKYKITMHTGDDNWTVVDSYSNQTRALESLNAFRNTLRDRTFRLEAHTMEVLDA